ncbi:hypothetical protein ScPMuIL_008015 [Solemya velum]
MDYFTNDGNDSDCLSDTAENAELDSDEDSAGETPLEGDVTIARINTAHETNQTTHNNDEEYAKADAFSISKDRLSALLQWYKQEGLTPKEKKTGGRKNNTNSLSMDDVKRVLMFLHNYAENNALLPGRVPGFKREDVKLLPSSHTHVHVYTQYILSLEGTVPTFKKRTSLGGCFKQKSTSEVRSSGHYNEMVHQAKVTCHATGIEELQTSAPCSRTMTMHYSFDFAQQVHLPSNPLQPGPIYILFPRKCGIFGVCYEGIPKQVNFLVDEAHSISKGSNTVVSYLHFFLGRLTSSCTATIALDKTRTVLSCGIAHEGWQLDSTSPYLHFFARHTKFAPDRCFGLLNQAFRRHAVSSLAEMVQWWMGGLV